MPIYVGQNPDAKFWYTQIDLISSAGIEAPKNFDNVNAIGEFRFVFPGTNLLGGDRSVGFFIDPYVGYQFGKNLKSPLPSAKGSAISRLELGGSLDFLVPVRNRSLLKGLEFESS